MEGCSFSVYGVFTVLILSGGVWRAFQTLPLAWIPYPYGADSRGTSGVDSIQVSECSSRRESPMIESTIPASRGSGLRQKLGTKPHSPSPNGSDGHDKESGSLSSSRPDQNTWPN